MQELQSILLENVELSLPDFLVRRVALNQHMPRVEKLSEHVHDYHQWLVYLRGRGRQILEGETLPVHRGTVVVVKRGLRHRFINDSEVRPVCLAIDFETSEREFLSMGSLMDSEGLIEIERLLVSLNEEDRKKKDSYLARASLIFQVLTLIENAFEQGAPMSSPGPVTKKVEQSIEKLGLIDASASAIAEGLECSLDHLNRRLKSEGGKSLGRIISEARMKASGRLLKEGRLSIGEVGARVGIDDQNYFSRWFRKHSGKTPREWRDSL